MDEITYFKILGFLIVIGTFASLLSGVALPGSPTSSDPIGNLDPGLTQVSTTGQIVCHPANPFGVGGCLNPWGCPAYCDSPSDPNAWFGIPMFIGWVVGTIIGGVAFGVTIFGFFSGISAFIGSGSTFSIPEPLGFILFIGILFAWIFLALEALRRVIGIIWGR
jgi:hypothetical protein